MASPQITDRAKRYRAQNNVTGPKKCAICGRTGKLDVMHLTGNEAHGEKQNLAYGCRSCNAALGAAFKKIGAGKPTNQYNPAKQGYPTFEQYMWAVSNHTRGEHDAGGAVIHATPKHKRVEYARRVLTKSLATKRAMHEDRWNPSSKSERMAYLEADAKRILAAPSKYKPDEVQWAKDMLGKRNPGDYVAGRQAGIDGRPIKTALADHLRDVEQIDLNRKLSASERKIAIQRFRAAYKEGERARALGRRNPAAESAEVFEEFHGFAPSEIVTVSKSVHHHEHLAALGTLTILEVWGVDEQGHSISGFKKAMLCTNEDRNQLFIEGGDQRMRLADFGIRQTHELETLGRVTNIGYQTNKTHLGDEGGEAVYVHRFRSTNQDGKHVVVKMTREPDLIYDVRNEQLLFSGGSYEILREGIDK